jgi:uncharacterized membrane protein YfcA
MRDVGREGAVEALENASQASGADRHDTTIQARAPSANTAATVSAIGPAPPPKSYVAEAKTEESLAVGRIRGVLWGIGGIGGVVSGLLGVGGGILMVPMLVLWGKISQREAHALSIGAIVPISIGGILTYGALGQIRIHEALFLAVGAVAGARVGAFLLTRVDEGRLKTTFGVVLVLVAMTMLVRR